MNTLDRNYTVETVRVVAMLLIVYLHFWQNAYLLPSHGEYEQSIVLIMIRSIASISVPLYIYISGWFQISFKLNKVYSLWKHAVFYALVSAILMLVFFDGPYKHLISSFLPVTRGPWWFLSSYIVLMVIAPFINQGFAQMSQKHIRPILFLISTACCFCMQFGSRDRFGGSLLTLVTIYMWAMYHKKYLFPIKNSKIYAIIALFLLIISGFFGYYYTDIFDNLIKYIWAYNSIVIMLTCAFVFDALINSKTLRGFSNKNCRWITFLSSSTFQVYLLHESYVGKKILSLSYVRCDSVVVVLLGVAACFILCVFVDKLRIGFVGLICRLVGVDTWRKIKK